MQRKPSTFDGAMCKFWMYPGHRVTKVSGIVNISKITGHATQQRVLLDCLEVGQMITTMNLHNKLAFYYIGSPRKLLASFPCRKAYRILTANPHTHQSATEKVEEFTPFCAMASNNSALPTPSRLSEQHPLLLSNVAEKT